MYKESINPYVEDDPCEICNGSGEVWKDRYYVTCYACNGAGYHLTQKGIELMEFLNKFHKKGHV